MLAHDAVPPRDLRGRWREMAGDGGRWREKVGDSPHPHAHPHPNPHPHSQPRPSPTLTLAPAARHLREAQLRVDALLDLVERGHVTDRPVQVVVLHHHGRLGVEVGAGVGVGVREGEGLCIAMATLRLG